jgi:hypothetical protein
MPATGTGFIKLESPGGQQVTYLFGFLFTNPV